MKELFVVQVTTGRGKASRTEYIFVKRGLNSASQIVFSANFELDRIMMKEDAAKCYQRVLDEPKLYRSPKVFPITFGEPVAKAEVTQWRRDLLIKEKHLSAADVALLARA